VKVSEGAFGVLLVRRGGQVDGTFGYESDRLPELDEVIELTRVGAELVPAKVTGLEPAKSLPIRATELS
jgi:hypothetical protein